MSLFIWNLFKENSNFNDLTSSKDNNQISLYDDDFEWVQTIKQLASMATSHSNVVICVWTGESKIKSNLLKKNLVGELGRAWAKDFTGFYQSHTAFAIMTEPNEFANI